MNGFGEARRSSGAGGGRSIPRGITGQASQVLVAESERAGTFRPARPAIDPTFRDTQSNLNAEGVDSCSTRGTDTAMGTPLKAPDFDFNHRLDTWLDRLTTAQVAIGLPMLPSAAAAVEALRAVGDIDGQSWRYGRVRQKGAQKAEPAFPSELRLPVRDLQRGRHADAFVKDAFADTSKGGGSLFWDLGAIALDPSVLPNWRPKPSVGPRRPPRWWKSRKA